MSGRFAPSPTGDLHVGNLRTALIAWLSARARGVEFIVRMEDLDRSNASPAIERRQLEDLAAIGLDWDGTVIRQSDRFDRYDEVLNGLITDGVVYPCFCTRREIREASQAPHGEQPDAAYPGTCRDLSPARRARRAEQRPAALRLRTGGVPLTVHDDVCGDYTATLDDFVLRRNDGVPAYHLAVVVDDADQQVTEVVRGDDLLPSTPRHVYLQRVLGLPTPRYVHVPLVVGHGGERLAKRDGAITLADLAQSGVDAGAVRAAIFASLCPMEPGENADPAGLLACFATADHTWLGGDPVPLARLQKLWTAP